MKMLEHVEEGLIRQRVEIEEMQCGFLLGCGTADAIFICTSATGEAHDC